MSEDKNTEEESWDYGDKVAEALIYFIQVICFLIVIICFILMWKGARAEEFPEELKDSTQTYVCYPIEQTEQGPVCNLSLGWVVTWGMAVEWQIDKKPFWIKFRNDKTGKETLFPPPRGEYACTVVGGRPSSEYCSTVKNEVGAKLTLKVENPAGGEKQE